MYAGMTAICTYWNQDLGPILASNILKRSTQKAFNCHGRSLTAPGIIDKLPETVMEIERNIKNDGL